MKKQQPVIRLKKSNADYVLEAMGWGFVLCTVALPLFYYSTLPDQIPIHFGPNGQADGFGSKVTLWIMPLLSVLVYTLLLLANRYPHRFNYPSQITPDNAEEKYRRAAKGIRTLGIFTTLLFGYLTYAMIQTALGNQDGLGTWFIYLFFGAIAMLVVYFSSS